jgi:hypothetical protein
MPLNDIDVTTSLNDIDFVVSDYWPSWQTNGAGGAAVVRQQTVGNQDVTLIGFDAQFRAHPKNGFRMVANTIYNGLDLNPAR